MWRLLALLLLVPLVAAHGDDGHTVPAWGSPTLAQDDTYERTFDAVRLHRYQDAFTSQTGAVQVVAGGPMTGQVTLHDTGFSPPVVEIGPGGRVTWTIAAEGAHTVTSTEMKTIEEPEESPAGLAVAVAAVAAAFIVRRRAA